MPLNSPLGLSFFQHTGAHPDLHPFPTRRSSDLEKSPRLESLPKVTYFTMGANKWQTSETWPPAGAHRDRKSTRLNSSHANISYAVFCLKKKEQPAAPWQEAPRRGRYHVQGSGCA